MVKDYNSSNWLQNQQSSCSGMIKKLAVVVVIVLCFSCIFLVQNSTLYSKQKFHQITESEAVHIATNFISKNISYSIVRYTSFQNLHGRVFYVFELKKDKDIYMYYISPAAYAIGPNITKKMIR